MQVVLCDICERPIRGQALKIHLMRGEAVNTEGGRPRIIQRGNASMRYACSACGNWIEQAIGHLRASLIGTLAG